MRKKRIMLLGGIRYLIPVIKAAHEQGYYVITADYLPNNIAHRYSDEYVNVSVTDKESVLRIARKRRIDGIMSFGVDPGVVSAAYVQEQMGLPSFGPYESVHILQNKDLFRSFLLENGFNVPKAKGYQSIEEAMENASLFDFPVIVKPTDSAGSKGVTRVDNHQRLRSALVYAQQFSLSGRVIVEEFIDKQGYSSDSDCMSINGKLVFVNFNSQRFDEKAANPYTPAAYTWPSTYSPEQERFLTKDIQRIITLLKLKTVVYNIETRIASDGKPYIMELTPRGGGNRLSEMIRFATGVDMITAITRAMVGDSVDDLRQPSYNGNWAEIILHSYKDGIFHSLNICDEYQRYVQELDLWVKKGDYVNRFYGANNAIGTLVMRFENTEKMEYAIQECDKWLRIIIT